MLRREDVLLSIFDEEAFAELPSRLARTLGARSTIIQWRHRDGAFDTLGFCHFTPDWIQGYTKKWARLDPWVIAGHSPNRMNNLMLGHQVVPDRLFANSTIYNEYIRAQGDDTLHAMGGAFQSRWGSGSVAVHRGERSADFEEADLLKFRTYGRELNRLFRVKGELAAASREARQTKSALDALAYAIMTVNPDGRILSANTVAERVLKRGDGLVNRQGVACTRYGQDGQLHAAFRQASTFHGPVATSQFIYRGEEKLPYLMTTCPVGTGDTVMIVFCDPDVEDVSIATRLQGIYSLTNSEATIAIDISKGKSAAEIARSRGVSANTLKTQISSIMQKMKCHRQAEVAALVAGLPGLDAR